MEENEVLVHDADSAAEEDGSENVLSGYIYQRSNTVSGNDSGASSYIELSGLDNSELIDSLATLAESLQVSQYYGSIGDYYNQILGFTVFPDFDTYEYFIDIDAMGSEWVQASDGHYVRLENLDAYEEYIENGEMEFLLSEEDADILETLHSINGLLTKIDADQTQYYEAVYAYQEESLAWREIQAYSTIGGAVLTGVVAGCLLADSFFGKMRLG